MRFLRMLWDVLRGRRLPPPLVDVEDVARGQDALEPRIRDLERAAAFRKWERERNAHRG